MEKIRKRRGWNSYVFYLLPLVLWLSVIFYASSQPYKEQDTKPWIRQHISLSMVERHFSNVDFRYGSERVSIQSLGAASFVEFFIRKGSHLAEFALLAFLLVRTLWVFTNWKPLVVAAAGIGFCFAYACLDEYHQSFTADRTAHFIDARLDTVGAMLGVLVFMIIRQKVRRGKMR